MYLQKLPTALQKMIIRTACE